VEASLNKYASLEPLDQTKREASRHEEWLVRRQSSQINQVRTAVVEEPVLEAEADDLNQMVDFVCELNQKRPVDSQPRRKQFEKEQVKTVKGEAVRKNQYP